MQPIKKKTTVRSAVLGLILVVVLIEFGRTNLGKFCIVDGESMCPTLNPGDVVQARISYVKTRGDVVVITDDSGHDAVKRIVGLPGESVGIHDGEVYVNSRRLVEPYLNEEASTFRNNQKNEPASIWHLTADEYFVMGDNRFWSCDSRHYGPIRQSQIHGIVALPKNAPGPAFVGITVLESGREIRNPPARRTADRSRTLASRRTSRNTLRSPLEAVVR